MRVFPASKVKVPVPVVIVFPFMVKAVSAPEKFPVPVTSKLYKGVALPIPNLLLALSQKKFALSCVKYPLVVINGIEPTVKAVEFNTCANIFLFVEGEKYNCVPSYSTTPASAVVKFTPVVNLSGAVPAAIVPAFKFNTAVGVVTPIPTLPLL